MPSFKETFPRRHAILPVIHVQNADQTLRNTDIARNAGADGVFLIGMMGPDHYELEKLAIRVKGEFPDYWIGVNYLDLPPRLIFLNLNARISGVWTDNARINEESEDQYEANLIDIEREWSQWEGLYFGGVAFKYQRGVTDLEKAAKIASSYVDVVVTSGDKTGSPPDVEKIKTMKQAIGDYPLGIASGISPENVKNYLGTADVFMVATSLLKPHTEYFEPSKVKALVEAVRG